MRVKHKQRGMLMIIQAERFRPCPYPYHEITDADKVRHWMYAVLLHHHHNGIMALINRSLLLTLPRFPAFCFYARPSGSAGAATMIPTTRSMDHPPRAPCRAPGMLILPAAVSLPCPCGSTSNVYAPAALYALSIHNTRYKEFRKGAQTLIFEVTPGF